MKGDFTRNRFRPERHYQQVLQQQGRVQLDADANEQSAIALRRDETTARDVIGSCGGPAEGAGFGFFTNPKWLRPEDKAALDARFGSSPEEACPFLRNPEEDRYKLKSQGDFYLSAGRYYVDGVQCENEFAIPFSVHRGLPGGGPLGPGNYLVLLDVWRRHVSVLEDPALAESALGGIDTTTRVQVVWQARALAADTHCGDASSKEEEDIAAPSSARLSARTLPKRMDDDPCQLPEGAGFKGLENQLYRVELHEVGEDGVARSWKWSRENGSVVAGLTQIDPEKSTLTIMTLGRDERLDFHAGHFVEILDDALELGRGFGQILEIEKPLGENQLLLKKAPLRLSAAHPSGVDLTLHPRVRRWEGFEPIKGDRAKWLPLEAGIEVRLDDAGPRCRPGDYWTIPARASSPAREAGDIQWPMAPDEDGVPQPRSMAPEGIQHHVCRLGVVTIEEGTRPVFEDCRCLWPSLSAVPRLFYVGGDGQDVLPHDPAAPARALFPLAYPLVVGLANGHCLTDRPSVRFAVGDSVVDGVRVPGKGQVSKVGDAPAGSSVEVEVGPDGLARCTFHLDGTQAKQNVGAALADPSGQQLSPWILFNASLGVAREVAYDPGQCGGLAGSRTVQSAIERLASLATLTAVGGDGQDGAAGDVLPKPICVSVASACGPVAKAQLRFRVASGGLGQDLAGARAGGQELKGVTDENGQACCYWRLGSEPVQELTALIFGDRVDMQAPTELRFTANVRSIGAGDEDPKPIHVWKVTLRQANGDMVLENDATVRLSQLRELRVTFDSNVDEATIRDVRAHKDKGQPTLFVTAEVPFPLKGIDSWGSSALLGFRPLVLLADVMREHDPDDPPDIFETVVWRPAGQVLEFLGICLDRRPDKQLPILLRLTIKGNFVWAADRGENGEKLAAGYLDGDAYRSAAHPGLRVPSGDGRRGGDFEMWFWVDDTPN